MTAARVLPVHYKGIPKFVRVGAYDFKIEVCEAFDSMSNGEFGHCNMIGQIIRLAPDMNAQKLSNTFIHEVIHALHWVYGLLRQTSDGVGPEEEEFTTLGANGLCQFFRDNPETVKWWIKNLSITQ